MASMILFDGVDIQSVADVKIEDIRVSEIQIKDIARDRPISPGSTFVRAKYGTRTVSVTFALLNDNRISRHAALMAINAWAKSDKEYKIELPQSPDFYLVGTCTAKPDPSVRQWWESKLRLVFTCFENPFWTSKVEKSVACGTAYFVQGNAEPLMRIIKTREADASDVQYALNGRTIRFTTVPAGDMEIDVNHQTAKVGTASIMGNYNIVSRWIIPAVGLQTVTGDGTVKYRERWA